MGVGVSYLGVSCSSSLGMMRGAGFVMVMHDANNHGDETRKQPPENFEGVCHQ